MSYAIPTNELTLTDIKAFKGMAIEAGIARALALGVARSREELVVREAHPGVDFIAAYGATIENYITGVLVAGWQLCGATGVAALLPVGEVAVFYKIYDWQAAPDVTAVRFRVGGTGATTKASFMIQGPIMVKLEPEVWLSEPVVYDPQDTLFIQCYAVAGGATEDLGFGCFIVERVGATIS